MSRRTIGLTLVALLALAGPAAAQQGPLDLIPADATGAFAVRNLNDLAKKGDQFLKDTEMQVPIRPSQVFDMAFMFLGVQGAVDTGGSAAIVVVNQKVVGGNLNVIGRDFEKFLVAVIPFKDRDKIGASLGFKQGELKPDKLMPVKDEMRQFGKFCYVRGKHLFLGNLDKAVVSAARGKSVAAELSPAQRKALGEADMVLHLGTEAWGEVWKEFLRDTAKALDEVKENDEEGKVAKEFVEALGSVRFGMAGIRLDRGLTVNVLSVFPKDGGKARKFLTALRAGDGVSSLTGLPVGNVVAAQAAKGDGSKNTLIARVFFRLLLRHVAETNKVLSSADRPTFVGVFTEVWRRLRGSRFALYKTSDEAKLGLFAAVGILDTDDPEKFLKELQLLAKFGVAEGVDLTSDAGKEANLADVKRLVGELGHRRFAVRESATTKLLLIGEPVLPYLAEALKSKDAEVAKRAERIKSSILTTAEARRKALLSKEFTRAVKPSFAFLPKGEELGGTKVRLVSVRLPKKDAALVPQLRQLLGPDWNRVRIATHGKQVVVLVGSDKKLLREALRNLKENKPGLAAAPPLKEFTGRVDPARKIEFHFSVQTGIALAKATDLEKPGQIKPGEALSSVALTVEPDRLRLDLWIPSAEFKAISKVGARGGATEPAPPPPPQKP